MTPARFRLRRVASSLGLFAVVLSAMTLVKIVHFRTSSMSDSWVRAALVFLLIALATATASIVQLRRPEPSRWMAVCLAAVGLIAALVLPGRILRWAKNGEEGWPLSGMIDRWNLAPTDERIAFAIRVAASESEDYRLKHGALPANAAELESGVRPSVVRDVAVRVATAGDTMPRVIGTLSGRTCTLRLVPGSEHAKWNHDFADADCADSKDGDKTPAPAAVSRPMPTARTSVGAVGTPVSGSWLQYRGDEGRHGSTGETALTVKPAGWQAHLWGEGRSTPSIVGNIVLIGAHGSGVLDARDKESGRLLWRAREPNWVHQDVVSDGRIAVVGFGDNQPSKYRLAPSGISARDLKTGVLLWRRLTHGSEMTSPVIASSIVVAGTSDGEIVAVDLASGKLRWEGTVPGGVVMAPPALRGDTVFFSADPSTVCAVSVATGRHLWCTNVPNAFKFGHSAVTVQGGSLFATSTRPTGILEQMFRRDFQPKALLDGWFNIDVPFLGPALPPGALDVHQELIALSTATGEIQWRTPLGHGGMPEGHTSGTAVAIAGSSDLVVLSPAAHAVFRIRAADGRIVWRSDIGGRARGPVLIVGSHVIVLRADAWMQVIDVATGALGCRMQLPHGADRAGPALSGGLAVYADVEGAVYAVDAEQLSRCSANLTSLPDASARY